jgi:hypothetical protein
MIPIRVEITGYDMDTNTYRARLIETPEIGENTMNIEDKKILLSEYTGFEAELAEFKEYWSTRSTESPEEYPRELTQSEWDEQFQSYIGV